MKTLRYLVLLAIAALSTLPVHAADISLLSKYGLQEKNAAQKNSDAAFLADMDKQFNGDRKAAANAVADRGWDFLRSGDAPTAMRRFNQAWLLDEKNLKALWGMGAISGQTGKTDEATRLFTEAEPLAGDDIDFAVDHARTVGIAAAHERDAAHRAELFADAYARFAHIREKAPDHAMNLQNWAMALYYAGDYAGAWDKIKLAEATPRAADLDPKFIAALEKKMPRP